MSEETGIEVFDLEGSELLARQSSKLGFSGWVAYSYERTQQTDPARAESYWADFDQRHTFNLFTVYRFPDSTSVGKTFRAGTSEHNQVRLPPYARLDLRAGRQFRYLGHRLTLFVDALNPRNLAPREGSVEPAPGEATGFTDSLCAAEYPLLVVIAFWDRPPATPFRLLLQKSNCALILAMRAARIDVGVSQRGPKDCW